MSSAVVLPVMCIALACGANDEAKLDRNLGPETTASVAAPVTAVSALQLVSLDEFQGGSEFTKSAEATYALLRSPVLRSDAGPTDPTLRNFSGGREFLKVSSRLRVWRAAVEYKMEVDAEGHATKCELTNKFRKNYINLKLCEVLMQHHTFEPAHDAQDRPVAGVYRSSLNYMDLRKEQ